ncbi:MAG: hypothetical protein WD035_11645 [Balneolaceae bacterium]
MSNIIILPWLNIREPIEVGPFRYVPVDLQYDAMEYEDREILTQAVEPFRIVRERSLRSFVLVELQGETYLRSYSEDEIERFKFFNNLLTISCLSNRMFFQPMGGYINSDTLEYYIRRYSPERNFQTVYGRKRDGHIMSINTERSEIIKKPVHVSRILPYVPDITLLNSLIAAKDELRDRYWYKIYNSILNFISGNTDNIKISPTQEIISLRSSFELLLSERNLQSDFSDVIVEFTELRLLEEFPEILERPGRLEITPEVPICEAWIREFIALRDHLAHGNSLSLIETRWSLHEHLLLASFINPVILKWFLQEHGQYTLNNRDIARFKAFEQLAGVQHFVDYLERENEEGFEYPWNTIFSRYLHRAFIEEHIRNNE